MSFVLLYEHCSSWGSLWRKAAVPLVLSCTDGCTTRRGTQYDGDPAWGTSRLFWETVVPKWGMAEEVPRAACMGESKLSWLTKWEGEEVRTCTA